MLAHASRSATNRSANCGSMTAQRGAVVDTWWARKRPEYAVLSGTSAMPASAAPNQARM